MPSVPVAQRSMEEWEWQNNSTPLSATYDTPLSPGVHHREDWGENKLE